MAVLEIPALQLQQSGYTFYVGRCSAKALLDVAYVQRREEGEGIQRILSNKRLREIGAYLLREEPPGLLPNAIILALESGAKFNSKRSILSIPRVPRQAFVVDGQHRLFAFQPEYVGEFDMDVPISAFIDLPLSEMAYLFKTINSTQRKINPSLVYDLIPLLREQDWVDFEDSRAQYLVQRLNEEESSPWFRRIAMLGGRDQPITQASFVTAIKRLLKPGEPLSEQFMDGDFFGLEMQYELLETYFSALAYVFSDEWMNANYVLSKNLGVSTFLNVLGHILQRLRAHRAFFDGNTLLLEPKSFYPLLRKARGAATWRRADMAKSYLGAAGIRTLTDEILGALS